MYDKEKVSREWYQQHPEFLEINAPQKDYKKIARKNKQKYHSDEYFRIRHIAQKIVHYYLRIGRIKRVSLCERCERPSFTQAHHENYKRPMEVIGLCQQCHTTVHDGRNLRFLV
jgi:hypothetical protein